MAEKYWVGKVPTKDDFGAHIGKAFIDGRTRMGVWGIMNPNNHQQFGVGLGAGRGQRYELQGNGRWLKVEG